MMAEVSIYAIKNHPQKQKQNTTPKKFLSKKVVNKQKSVVLLFGQAKGKRRSALPERKGVREWKGCWCYSLGFYSRRSAPSPFDFVKNDRPADD